MVTRYISKEIVIPATGLSVAVPAWALAWTALGSKHDVDYFYSFLKKPEQTYGRKDDGPWCSAQRMHAYVSALPDSELRTMAIFLSELKADQGSSSSFEPPPGDSSFIDAMLDMWAPDNWRTEYKDIRDWMKTNPQEGQHDEKH